MSRHEEDGSRNPWRDFTPLADVGETHGFLQILVRRLEVKKTPTGLDFELRIGDDDPALLRGADKKRAAEIIDHQALQIVDRTVQTMRGKEGVDRTEPLKATLEAAVGRPGFGLRFASGGVLPCLETRDGPRVLLFFRDIHPIGWNIANGASSDRDEFTNIEAVMDREAEEEILFVDPAAKRLCAFGAASGPEASKTRTLWRDALDLDATDHDALPSGRDEGGGDGLSVIDVDRGRDQHVQDLFVEVQAEDFGIEAARIRRMPFPDDLIPVDGELLGDRLLDRPIGLFALDALTAEHPKPSRWFQGGVEKKSDAPKAPLCPITARLLSRWRP